MNRKRKPGRKTYKYECTLTGDVYKVSAEAPSPDDLVSVQAYYELNPEKDDRPEVVKIKLGVNTDPEE